MSKRKNLGAPWSPMAGPNPLSRGKVHSGGPALNPTTLAHQGRTRYLDPHAAANDIRKASAMPSYVGLELPALPPLQS